MYPYAAMILFSLAVSAQAPQSLTSAALSAQRDRRADVIWDISQRGLFDPTNKAYLMDGGQVRVNLDAGDAKCPSGLGELGTGRPDVKEVHLVFQARESGNVWLHVLWDPGGSGRSQFAVSCNGEKIGESERIDTRKQPYRKIASRFNVPLQLGRSDIALVYRSGGSLRLENIVLSKTEDYSAGKELPPTFNPDLKYPTLADYEKAIQEQAVMLDSTYVRMFAPKRRAAEANIIFPYLVKAYDELYKIVGVHTRYKIMVYHFPENSPDTHGSSGYVSDCTLWYQHHDLDLASQSEWQQYHVPHVCNYIEEIAHSFIHAMHAEFSFEMMGWTIGMKVAQKVAGNPILTRHLQETRQRQFENFQRYVQAGYVLPRDVPANLCDRIHACILYQAEMQYGPGFWPDVFARIREQKDALAVTIHLRDSDECHNARYRITVDCFDKLDKIHFKDRLRQAHISVTTHIVEDSHSNDGAKAIHTINPNWDRRFLPPSERSG